MEVGAGHVRQEQTLDTQLVSSSSPKDIKALVIDGQHQILRSNVPCDEPRQSERVEGQCDETAKSTCLDNQSLKLDTGRARGATWKVEGRMII